MNTELLNQISLLMDKLPNHVYGREGVNKEWILDSENKYGMTLPSDYVCFLKKYGYILLWGEMLKTIFPPEMQEYSDQDIFNYHQIRLDNDEEPNRLVFLATDELEEYYFLISDDGQISKEVYFADFYNSDELYADNFVKFLLKEIPRNYKETR